MKTVFFPKKLLSPIPTFGTLLVLFLFPILFMGCERPTSQSETEKISTLERLRAGDMVRLGYANEAPYAYFDSKENRLTGEAPEIARAVLDKMGIKQIKGVLTEFGSLIPGLKARRFDLIAAGMYITPERCLQIYFSNPTYAIGEAFMVQTGNPLQLHSYEDVAKNPNARLGVVAGAIEFQYALATEIPHERIFVLPDAPSAVAGVQAGRIDAYAGTSLTIQDLLAKAEDTNIEQAKPFRDPVIDGKSVIGYGAFGFHQEDSDFLEAFNTALKGFIGSEAHLKLIEPFGFTKDHLPGEVTAKTLCGS